MNEDVLYGKFSKENLEPCCAICERLENGVCPYAGLIEGDELIEKVCFGYIEKE